MTAYKITLCGGSCDDTDYLTLSHWSAAPRVDVGITPFVIRGVEGISGVGAIDTADYEICRTLCYCYGPTAEGVVPESSTDLTTRWKAMLVGQTLLYGIADEALTEVSADFIDPDDLEDAETVSMCFDQFGLPNFAIGYSDGSTTIYWHFDGGEVVSTKTITAENPQLYFNGCIASDPADWDVICYYVNGDSLVESLLSDLYANEYTLTGGVTAGTVVHVDNVGGYELIEVQYESRAKELFSVDYTPPVDPADVVDGDGADSSSCNITFGSIGYGAYVEPTPIDGAGADSASSTVAFGDITYSEQAYATEGAQEDEAEATISFGGIEYLTPTTSTSATQSAYSSLRFTSNMAYINTGTPDSIWRTTPPTISTTADGYKAVVVVNKTLAAKSYTYSTSADGALYAVNVTRASDVAVGQLWAYLSDTWNIAGSSSNWTTTPVVSSDIWYQPSQVFTNWSFDSGSKQLTFTAASSIYDFDYNHPERLYLLRNITKGVSLYINPGARTNPPTESPISGYGGTWVGGTLTLDTSLSGKYDAGDILRASGVIAWDIDDAAELPWNYSMPSSWQAPMVMARSSLMYLTMNSAAYAYQVIEARATHSASVASSGFVFMPMVDFLTDIQVP